MRAQNASCGELLRQFRLMAGLTQEQLADACGYSADYVGKLERGQRHPPVAALRRVAAVLGLEGGETDELLAARERRAGEEPGVAPLAGRTSELAQIRRLLAGIGQRVLLFGGEPGVGKTRLLDEAAALAAQAGWRVLHGDCRRRAGDPYAPLTEAVADSLRRLPQGERQSVVRVAPFLHLLLPELLGTGDVRFDEEVGIAPSPSALPPEHRRRLLFAAVTDYLHAVAGAAGTLLVLDDLQWAGEDALDLLASSALIERGQALMRPDAKRLRVIGAYRDTEPLVGSPLGEFVAELARGSSVRMLSLGPFSDAWAEKLLLGQISAG